jgi:hypothetical protein
VPSLSFQRQLSLFVFHPCVQCAVWIFVSNHRSILAADSPFFAAYFLSTMSLFIRLYRTGLSSIPRFVLHRFGGARSFPAESWFWISPLVRFPSGLSSLYRCLCLSAPVRRLMCGSFRPHASGPKFGGRLPDQPEAQCVWVLVLCSCMSFQWPANEGFSFIRSVLPQSDLACSCALQVLRLPFTMLKMETEFLP